MDYLEADEARCLLAPLDRSVERSHYAKKVRDRYPRIVLHVGPFVVKGAILQYFERTMLSLLRPRVKAEAGNGDLFA